MSGERLQAMVAVRLVTHDPDRLARFYAEALGAEVGPATPMDDGGAGERWTLRLGAQRLELDRFAEAGAPYPADIAADDPRFQHVAMVAADVRAAFQRAIACGAQAISTGGPVQLPAASGGAVAVKLRDPEGHPFELIGLGGAWEGVPANAQGVRGFDHSAIPVADAEASRRFYAAHGLAERGGTFNHGPEQAALDGLPAPEVDVVPLFAPVGTPHLELLGYRRSASLFPPVGERDLAATRIVWRATGAPEQLRDPDGHRHVLLGTT